MTGLLEPCAQHEGSPLNPVLFAPGKDGLAEAYWRGVQSSPVAAGDAVTVRSTAWLVVDVALWRGRPGGVHLRLLECNAAGILTARPTATRSGYGVSIGGEAAPVPIVGHLTVTATADPDGRVATLAELQPVGQWAGQSGDLIELSDESRWEQVGDPTATMPHTVQLRSTR